MTNNNDLKNFYESTTVTEKHIEELYSYSCRIKDFDKNFFIQTSNTAFGMLAHLRISSSNDMPNLRSKFQQLNILEAQPFGNFYNALKNLGISVNFSLNPTAVPIIQKYISVFENYEKKIGIQNPFTKKEGKEPGDN